ncbi:hypothetical protein [Cytobacillus firmus]|uniref:hypothetical protein n=1 Tax=Cytobacillus firmus TaxID=1399 RepID=UPI0018CD3717|nr:hypothetical protein [Cytobacillus firmus]MBG9444639.1 hypothetical protein [Cytobacillus firmus]
MKKYKIRKLKYNDNYGKDIKLHVQELELRDNTEEFAGYWDIRLGKIKGFTLKEGDNCNFIFEADNDVQLIGEGKVQYDGSEGYNLIGKNIDLK